MDLEPTSPLGTNEDHTLPYHLQIGINFENYVKLGQSIKFESEIIYKFINKTYIISYSWDFGDGNTSSNSVTSNVFNDSGIYTAKLKINASERLGCYPTEPIKKYFGETTKTIIVE